MESESIQSVDVKETENVFSKNQLKRKREESLFIKTQFHEQM
jgi:hypothetical protein